MRNKHKRSRSVLGFDRLETRTLLTGTGPANDTELMNGQQWGLSNPANNGVDIDALNAWGITAGSPSVIVADIGTTGIYLDNPDLTANEWSNPSNDPQGFPSGIVGWNYSQGGYNSNIGPNSSQGNNHDTHVVGVIASNPTDPSGPGVTGVAYNTKFMYVEGYYNNDLAAAMNFAVAHGAKVINMSFAAAEDASNFPSDPLYNAIKNAENKAVVVVAAGNDGAYGYIPGTGWDDGLNGQTLYPASYNLPNMITVAAINSDGTMPAWSNYGTTTVALGAPGNGITTTDFAPTNYTLGSGPQTGFYGTSAAAPFVAGVAALVEAQNPNLTPEQVVNLIDSNTKPLASLQGKTETGGMVDAYYALEAGAHTNPGGMSLAAGSTTGTGSFAPDTEFTTGGATFTTSNPITTTGITNPPPQSVLQAERWDNSGLTGPNSGFTYTIPGLTPGRSYTVRLDFSENNIPSGAVGDRVFDVAINGTNVLHNFDIFATAGSLYTAVARSFTETADSWGKISIKFTSDVAQAKVDGIEVAPAAATSVAIAAGSSAAIGPFSADAGYTGGQGFTNAVPIDTTGVADAPPEAVFQQGRVAYVPGTNATFSYAVPGLTPGAAYTVRLDFVENFYTAENDRLFDVAIDGAGVLAGFDIFKAAGDKEDKAVAESFTARAGANGAVGIVFTDRVGGASVCGIEVAPAASGSAYIAAGSAVAIGPFSAETGDFTGGNVATYAANTVTDTSGIADAPPQAVYQSERYANDQFSYMVPGLTPGVEYDVRLDFSESYYTGAGQRKFDVAINNLAALTGFDIYAAAGGQFKAVAESFAAVADANGRITILFTNTTSGNTPMHPTGGAKVDGIEITPA